MTNNEIMLMQAGATLQADAMIKYLNEHNFAGIGLVMQTLRLDMSKDFEGKQESV
jgi:hypothetical protein